MPSRASLAPILLLALFAPRTALGEPPPPPLIERYLEAVHQMPAETPRSAGLEVAPRLPFPDLWFDLTRQAWIDNQPGRQLLRSLRDAQEPLVSHPDQFGDLSSLRHLANTALDMALLAHLEGNDREALELLRDTLTLARRFLPAAEHLGDQGLMMAILATSMEGNVFADVLLIAPGLQLADTPTDTRVSPDELRGLIRELLESPSVDDQLDLIRRTEPGPEPSVIPMGRPNADPERIFQRFARVLTSTAAEARFAAVSLAVQLYHHTHSRYPDTADALVPDFLPEWPADPAHPDAAPLGYILLTTPTGQPRPLVYSQSNPAAPPQFPASRPHYTHYDARPHQTQFRDLSRWTSTAPPTAAETFQPLP